MDFLIQKGGFCFFDRVLIEFHLGRLPHPHVERIESFGSGVYDLPLAVSDIDMLFIVRPGQSRSRLLESIAVTARADSAFIRIGSRRDTAQF